VFENKKDLLFVHSNVFELHLIY